MSTNASPTARSFAALDLTNRQKVVAGLVVVALAAGGIFAGTWGAGLWSAAKVSEEIGAEPLPVVLTVAEPQSEYDIKRSYSGVIKPALTSRIGFQQGGRVDDLYVDDGEAISKEDELAHQDQRSLDAQHKQIGAQLEAARAVLAELKAGPRRELIDAARAKVEELQARVGLAETELDRKKRLSASDASSKSELQKSEFDLQALEAQLSQAQFTLDELNNGTRPEQIDAQEAQVRQLEASLEQLEVDISHHTLRAPFDGVVARRLIDAGTIVDPGTPVFEIESKSVEAWIGLPPQQVKTLSPDQTYEIIVEGDTYEAKLKNVLPRLDAQTRTQSVVFEVAGHSEMPFPTGAIARLALTERVESDGFWIPSSALSPSTGGLWSVFVAQKDDEGKMRVYRRDVELMHLQEDRAFVRGTVLPGDFVAEKDTQAINPRESEKDQRLLAAGDQVVSTGVHRLVPGHNVMSLEDVTPSHDGTREARKGE